jgi:hypothetical protein
MSSSSNNHTIVLVQTTNNPSSRGYSDYNTLSAALDHITELFEAQLKASHPHSAEITYDYSELERFLDNSLFDLVLLVYDPTIIAYIPHNKAKIKQLILNQFKEQANN